LLIISIDSLRVAKINARRPCFALDSALDLVSEDPSFEAGGEAAGDFADSVHYIAPPLETYESPIFPTSDYLIIKIMNTS
jgi:hypothetical protein